MPGYSRITPVYSYRPLHITATGTNVAVGKQVATTAPTTIVAGSGVVVTPASMANIISGMILNFAGGTGSAEDIQVISTTATTFTANFVNGHSGAYNITSRRPIDIGTLVVGAAGSGVTITLYNGSQNLGTPGAAFAVITPVAGATYQFFNEVEFGLFYTLAGTPGDYTLGYLDHQP